MKAAKWIGIALAGYVGLVVAFESMIGIMQPQAGETLVITTSDADGSHDRVLAKLESDGALYVAANHWPRAWYRRALENPEVEVTIEGARTEHRAVPIEGAEYDRVNTEHARPLAFMFVTGFPSRPILRLDPR